MCRWMTSRSHSHHPICYYSQRILSLPDHHCGGHDEDVVEAGPDLLTKRTRHLNSTVNRFWERFWTELRESHRYHHGHTNPSKVSVDDVVIVHSTDQPRGFWKLGRVKEVLVGKQEALFSDLQVKVLRQATSLHRPIKLLYPLEVSLPAQDFW